MSFREMLISLSRATKFKDVYFDYELIKDKIFVVENYDDVIEQVNLKKCKLGYIYMLYSNKLQKKYIGQTSNTVDVRFNEHKNWKNHH